MRVFNEEWQQAGEERMTLVVLVVLVVVLVVVVVVLLQAPVAPSDLIF